MCATSPQGKLALHKTKKPRLPEGKSRLFGLVRGALCISFALWLLKLWL
jgi:hypothetical protein